jgi:hypothetical protein
MTKLDQLLQNVDRKWHGEFLRFVETGEAGDEFLQYLDSDKGGQQAVEIAFNAQAAAFEGLAGELRNPQAQGITEPTAAASARMVEAVEVVLQLPAEQREEVAEKTASVLEASLEPNQRTNARAVVQKLEHALAKVATKGYKEAVG